MDLIVLGVLGAAVVVAVNALAPRLRVPAALVLVVVGVAVSLIPAVPAIEIDPEWILAGVLPPLLYSTSVSMPAMDFRRDLTTIGGLSVALVVLSSVALGWLVTLAVPGIGLATGIALGAILSPTDAVATGITRRLGVSPRVVTVLEGESLLNDASALVLLRSAIAATAATVSLWHVVGDFLYAVVVAVVIGAVVGQVSMRVRGRLSDPHLTTAISFIVPFLAYLPAEHLGASGLVAAVTAGLVTGYGSAKHLRPADRLSETANWRTLELLLEGGVFLLMGLQVYGLVVDVRAEHGSVVRAMVVGVVAGLVVIVVRAAYVAPLLWALHRRAARGPAVKDYLATLETRLDEGGPARPTRPGPTPTPAVAQARSSELRRRITRRVADIDYLAAAPLGWREGAVLVWAGMRGVVTLAAAQSLPPETPQRSLLVLIAFVVAVGTLLVQGLTLPWLVRVLGLVGRDEGTEADERARLVDELDARAVALLDDPDLRRPDGRPYDEAVLARARRALGDTRADLAEAAPSDQVEEPPTRQFRELRLAVIAAQRAELLHARSLGVFSSAGLNRALAVLDADQMSTELRSDS
ncbi:MAG: sodium:proton antiporter [Cellulomonadaceae bacterium]|nr:sodium:proton antiporter [Cellulomonadaceae bacterium]